MSVQLQSLFEEYLQTQTQRFDVEKGIRAFALILSKTVHFRNDKQLVPALMHLMKVVEIPLVLEDLGIASGDEDMTRMSGEIANMFKQKRYDFAHFDGLANYDLVDLIKINLVKINRWAEALYERTTAVDLAQTLIDGLSDEQRQLLSSLTIEKIAFLGDSTMDSRHWSAVAAFPDILGEMFKLLKTPVTVINAGIGGNKSNQGLARVDADIIAHQPELCYFAFGGNDSSHNPETGGFTIPLDEFRINLISIVRKLQNNNIEPIIGLTTKAVRYQAEFKDYQCFLNIIAEVSQEEQIKLLDLFNCISDEDIPDYTAEDGIHSNNVGQVRLAQVVIDHLITHFAGQLSEV